MPEFPGVTVNEGLAIFILCWVGFALWKFGWWIGYRILGKDDKEIGLAGQGLIELRRYVDSAVELHGTLKETQAAQGRAQEKQTMACFAHIETLGKVSDVLSDQQTTAVATNHEIDRLTRAATRACEVCQVIAEKQHQPEVVEHCKAIKQILASDSGTNLDVGSA